MLTATGRPRPDPNPDVIADAAGVTIRFECATDETFWLEPRLDLAGLDRLTAMVEAENAADTHADREGQ